MVNEGFCPSYHMSKLTDQQKIEIVHKYVSTYHNCATLAREYGVDNSSIRSLLIRRGVKIKPLSEAKRKYHWDESYFDVIDSEAKAYFLGLLYADGYNNESRGEIHLSLQAKDRHILDQFKLQLKSDQPLIFIDLSNRYHKNQQDVYRVSLSSRKMSKRLSELGCFQAKSLTLKFPTRDQVPQEFIRYFVRGCFDGDGCFVASKAKKGYIQYSAAIVSSKEFCESLQHVLAAEIGISTFLTTRFKERQNSTRSMQVSGNLQVMRFLDWIYADSQIHLQRKFKKYKLEKRRSDFEHSLLKVGRSDKGTFIALPVDRSHLELK